MMRQSPDAENAGKEIIMNPNKTEITAQNETNAYFNYDILTSDHTHINLADVVRNDDTESGFYHFYNRDGICVLSIHRNYAYAIALVEKADDNGESGNEETA